jgi:hypothetical protein
MNSFLGKLAGGINNTLAGNPTNNNKDQQIS